MVRRLLVSFTLHAEGTDDVWLSLKIDLGALWPRSDIEDTLGSVECKRVDLDPKTRKVAERRAREEDIDRPMIVAAAEKTYDVPEDAWCLIEAHFARVNLVFGDRTLDARTLLNGLLCAVATDGAWTRLPERFGTPNEFKSAWQRIVWGGAWDDAAHVLDRHFPGVIGKAHRDRLSTKEFPRGAAPQPLRSRKFGALETARYLKEINALAEAFPANERVKRDVAILRDTFAGFDRKDTAERNGVRIGIVCKTVSHLRTRGVDALRPARRGPRILPPSQAR